MSKAEQAPTTSWFYRVGDRDVGPVMSNRLRQLARQGRLSDDDLVRMGRTGQWVAAGSIDWLSARPRPKEAAPPEPADEPAAEPPAPSAAAEMRVSLGYALRNLYYSVTHFTVASVWVVRHVLGVVALIAIMVILFNILRDLGMFDWSGPVDVLGTVQTLGAEVKQLRAAKAGDAEWDQLAERGTAALKPVVARLERDASSENRIAQMLLWSARDCLPKMFVDARQEPSASEARYDEYMGNVAALEKNQPIYGGNLGGRINRDTGSFSAPGQAAGGGPEWTTIALIAVMVVADLAIMAWLFRAWQRRRA
ncbi:MAG: DUF4339 domain-containing protein [Planctomycetaceae bacterium]|nr:DUF4339 domain-containing protein [Planctomycetaceae bacterium]